MKKEAPVSNPPMMERRKLLNPLYAIAVAVFGATLTGCGTTRRTARRTGRRAGRRTARRRARW